MVSGNAMATSTWTSEIARDRSGPIVKPPWTDLADALLARPSVDLAILPRRDGAIVRSATRGEATVTAAHGRLSYRRTGGDPLGSVASSTPSRRTRRTMRTLSTDYPDSVVQSRQSPRPRARVISFCRPPCEWGLSLPILSPFGTSARTAPCTGDLDARSALVNRKYSKVPRRTTRRHASRGWRALGSPIPDGLTEPRSCR